MSNAMLVKMNKILARMQDMNPEELEIFLREGSERAAHILSLQYDENRDFRIVGEEALYGEVIIHQYCMDSNNSLENLKIDGNGIQKQIPSIFFAA